MNEIASSLATLNDTVLAPVYSWVGVFQNYIKPGSVWDEACGSTAASVLGFDQQMALFVNIKIESECCQSYGVCGETYSLDIIFDDTGRVSTSRFRFQHQVQKTQADYIKGLVETRKACDQYAASLTQYSNTGESVSRLAVQFDAPEPRSYIQ